METTDDVMIGDGSVDAVASSLLQGAPTEEPTKEAQPEETLQEETQEAEQEAEDVGEDSDEPVQEEPIDQGEDEQENADEAGPEELYTVKVDGQEVEVNLEDLKRSYSGQAYIQKGMQEAAAAKKEAESVYQQLLNERQQMSNLMAQLQSGQVLQPPQMPDRETFKNDPIGYMEEKMKYDEAKEAYDQQQVAMYQATQQQQQSMQMAHQAHLNDEMAKLAQIVPEFGDAEKAGKLRDELLSYGTRLGYSEAEIAEVSDHRAIVVLQKAMKYDQLVAGKDKAVQKASNARPVNVKPGAKKSPTTSRQKAKANAVARMKKSGSVDDVASYLLS